VSRPRLPAGLLLAVALAAGPGPLRAEDEAHVPAEAATVADLLARLDAPDPTLRFEAAGELRRRGPAAASALIATARGGTPALRRSAGAVLARVREDWHRSRVPEGMVYVPQGSIVRPSRIEPRGFRGRRLVDAFYIDRVEVTVRAWKTWVASISATLDLETREALSKPVRGAPEDWPVASVSWQQATRFAAARGGRLPEIEEFERALRGSGTRDWPWGPQMLAHRANLKGHGPGGPLPVGSFPAGAGPFGALDLVGNVAEWSSTTRATGLGGWPTPVVFGGSYDDVPEPRLGRGHGLPTGGNGGGDEHVGLRVARDVDPLPGEDGAPGEG
jgi:formylglycine-generating enzyme required for sulfatase activity